MKVYRGFESHLLRHHPILIVLSKSPWAAFLLYVLGFRGLYLVVDPFGGFYYIRKTLGQGASDGNLPLAAQKAVDAEFDPESSQQPVPAICLCRPNDRGI